MQRIPTMQINLPAAVKWCMVFVIAQWAAVPDPSKSILIVLVGLMALDYCTGICAAYITKKMSSEIGGRGIIKKGLMLCLLLAAHLLEKASGIELHLEFAGALGFCVNEGISIVENCAKAGVWVPAGLVEALITVQKLKGSGATPEQLAKLRGDSTSLNVSDSSEIIKTPPGTPDLIATEKTTVLTERHVEPIAPKDP